MNGKMFKLSMLVAGTVMLAVLGIFMVHHALKPKSSGIESAFNPSGDFTLTGDNGKIFHLKDLGGKVVLLFFGYTSCPDVCPLTLGKLARVSALLGKDAGKMRIVFITVDPEHDTAARLREYLGYFSAGAVGLTGTKAQIDGVVNAYHASYEKIPDKSGPGYVINHTNIVYLIDGNGKVRHLFHQDDTPEKMAGIVRKFTM